ncbi:RNA polymerase-associated protein rapA [Candidatus Thioglobus sp.]|nr:RNA polymerase-associated protein rapA [Candidatus Thioglobus sp.]
MKKQNLILSVALVAVFSASTAFAEAEVTGKIVHESAKFTTSGIGIGAATTAIQTADSHGKDNFKQETTAKIYIDDSIDELVEGATYHVELNLMKDGKALNDYDSNESYTQRDALREAYIDTTVDDWSIRAGKQQVVWGTADGMKLLDAINPTDYSEMAQNQMEDSRIPVWMINAETDIESGGNFQFILSEAKKNKIAGLNASGDQGHAFIMKGVDSITGKVDGFLNLVPAMGSVASTFNGSPGYTNGALNAATGLTVAAYIAGGGGGSWTGLNNASQATNSNVTRLTDGTASGISESDWSVLNPNSMFEYMSNATFATFDTFVGATSSYVVDNSKDSDANIGLKYNNSTENGVNYSANYMYAYDTNPYIDINWKNSSGEILTTVLGTNNTIELKDSADLYYGEFATGTGVGAGGADAAVSRVANLEFTEKLNRIQNLGGSFDMAVETKGLGPVVIRGEGLYQKDVMTPILDRNKLGYGDLPGALQAVKGDYFKYVLGADITAMTNMMVSAQVIQIRNLDYVDNNVDASGTACAATTSNCGVYSADSAVMHMSNNLQKAEENKEFYSLFFSKPFGASGEHRWNNITMYEENGGKWNRLDAEFSIDDDTQATVEYNKYWGNENTQFGQLEKSSNIQVGVKYSF